MEINRACQLGELVNPAPISTYFTQSISTVFRFAYFTERSAVYFYFISIVFLLGTMYLVLRTINPNH